MPVVGGVRSKYENQEVRPSFPRAMNKTTKTFFSNETAQKLDFMRQPIAAKHTRGEYPAL